jgi:predicted RNA-binding protein YlqC (UPF0109 family)
MKPDVMLQGLVRAFADHPDDVSVDQRDRGNHCVLLKLAVHEKDFQSLFVDQDEVEESLRTLLKAAGGKVQKKIDLEVLVSSGKS